MPENRATEYLPRCYGVYSDISCGNCPYRRYEKEGRGCIYALHEDALALLKEQKTENTGSCRVFQCKKCGFGIDDIFVNDEEKYQIVPRYCPNCGRKVM